MLSAITRFVACSVFALASVVPAFADSAPAELTADESDRSVETYKITEQKIVDLVTNGGSFDDIEKLAGDIVAEWQPRDPMGCAYLMRELVAEVNMAQFDDQTKQVALERKLVRMGLANSKDWPTGVLVGLIEYTRQDLVEASREGDTKKRDSVAHLWLDTWRRVRDAVDPHWDPADVAKLVDGSQFSNIFANGMSPEAIEDPVARAKYVAACEEQARMIRRRGQQIKARRVEREFAPVAEKAIVESYSVLPVKESELRASLEKYHIDPMTIDRMLKSIQEARTKK
jgi:hypothetical protein